MTTLMIQEQVQNAVDAGDLILQAHLQFREVKPGAAFKVGPVTVSRNWGPVLRCGVEKKSVRTDNGPAISHGSTEFTLPDGSKKKFGWMSGAHSPLQWGYKMISGEMPKSPNPELPFRGITKYNPPQPGSGHSSAVTEMVEVDVCFAGEEEVALDEWVKAFIEEGFKSGANPLPYLRKVFPGQWSFARYKDGRGMIHYVQASPWPVWSGRCEAEIPCD